MAESVTVSFFYTRNLGNFENAKVGYEITSDEKLPGETIDQFKSRLTKKVNQWVQQAIAEIDAEANN